jgi:hypothetical protein
LLVTAHMHKWHGGLVLQGCCLDLAGDSVGARNYHIAAQYTAGLSGLPVGLVILILVAYCGVQGAEESPELSPGDTRVTLLIGESG